MLMACNAPEPDVSRSPRVLPTVCACFALASLLGGCATPDPAPVPATTTPVAVATPVVAAPPAAPVAPTPAPEPATAPQPVEPVAAPKEPPPVDLPDYARRGKRLPANGGAPGQAVIAYCRGFEIDRDAQSYFKRLQQQNKLPTANEVAERSRAAGQPLTVQQVVERDWALRRENNRSAPQRCKVLGGSIEGATAQIAFEADLNGRRQRGIATVVLAQRRWRVRDHGDWSPLR